MRSLINYRQDAFQSASSKAGDPPDQISPPANPTETKMCLDALGVSSSEVGPPEPPPSWLKVQLARLKQFLVKALRVPNHLP